MKNKNYFKAENMVGIIVLLHLIFVLLLQVLQANAGIGGDGIFTYTLANNPYAFEYIDPEYKYLPKSDEGWISARVLRDSYIVGDYSQFNYSGAYFHQRIDNHPLAYYFLVHTVCSVFKETYSPYFTMIINLFFAGLADLVFIKLFKKIYGKTLYVIVPFVFLFFMVIMQQLYTLARMYMMLAFFCLWYIYIHYGLLDANDAKWKKSSLVQFTVCILLGSQTHYYFYVYAAVLSLLMAIYLIYKHEIYKLLNYIYAGIIGICISWMIFPWMIWHIFFNQMQKHTDIIPWSLEKIKGYLAFLNQRLLNGRWVIAIIVVVLLIAAAKLKGKKTVFGKRVFCMMVLVTSIIFSLIIYTLDEDTWGYFTPIYIPFIILLSICLINLCTKILPDRTKTAILSAAICALLILSVSSTVKFVKDYLKSSKEYTQFSRIADDYEGDDCIFIETEQDNLLQGYFFQFGNYDEFKKIPFEEYKTKGISKEMLQGRKDNGRVVVYIPTGCDIYIEQNCELLADNGSYCIYEIKEEN